MSKMGPGGAPVHHTLTKRKQKKAKNAKKKKKDSMSEKERKEGPDEKKTKQENHNYHSSCLKEHSITSAKF